MVCREIQDPQNIIQRSVQFASFVLTLCFALTLITYLEFHLHLFYLLMLLGPPATKVRAIIVGQTSIKAPEQETYKYLPVDIYIVSCHSLHGPTISLLGHLLICHHPFYSESYMDLPYHPLASLSYIPVHSILNCDL